MRRREFLGVLGGAAAWPVGARAQQAAMPVIGYLSSRAADESANHVAAWRRGLSEAGYTEGQNVGIEFRWARGQVDRLSALASELARRPVAVIAAVGGAVSGLAAKAATSTIPIVVIGNDPVRIGLVDSINRPRGNVTGVNVFQQEMESKRLGLLRELVPTVGLAVAMVDPDGPDHELQQKDIQDAARALGLKVHIVRATSEQEIHAVFATVAELKAGALLVTASPRLFSRREQIVTLAAHSKIPALYEAREFAEAGGLMTYGTNLSEAYRQVGLYTGRILKGEKPTDLPVMQSTKFELVINFKTAKMLGIDIPPTLIARADEVIE